MYWIYGTNNSNTKMCVNMIQEFGMKYRQVDVDDDPVAKELVGKHGHASPPVVFWNDTYIGGWAEVKEDVLQRANGVK